MVVNLFTWPFYPVIIKRKATGLSSMALLILMMFVGMAIIIPPAIVENIIDHGSWLRQVRLIHLLSLVGLWIFPSILANQFQNTALTHVSANITGIFQYLVPIFVNRRGCFIFKEKFYLYHIIRGLLLFVGLLLVIRFGPKDDKPGV